MSQPYAKHDNIADEWIETINNYARRENPKGYVVDASDPTGKLVYYQKKIVDISGRNNHLYIGPQYINFDGIETTKYQLSKLFFGSLTSGTLYSTTRPHPQLPTLTISTKNTFILPDYTTGTQWWRTDRWHINQVKYYNRTSFTENGQTYTGIGPPYNYGVVQTESYVSNPTLYANLKDTERHYDNSSSIVPQFSDAMLYDFTDTSEQHKITQKRMGYYEEYYVGLKQSNSYGGQKTLIYIGGMKANNLNGSHVFLDGSDDYRYYNLMDFDPLNGNLLFTWNK